MEVGERIANMRKKKGLTLKELSVKSGIDEKLLQQIEIGAISYSSYIEKIAQHLEVEVMELLGETIEIPDELKELGVTQMAHKDGRELTPEELEQTKKFVMNLNKENSSKESVKN